jgi:SagB-type dehydrogenase family enzyme
LGRHVRPLPFARSGTRRSHEQAEEQYPLFAIGEADPAADAIARLIGKAAGPLKSGRLTTRQLAALLPRSMAADGKLVEIFFHVRGVDGLPAGLFRFGTKGEARLMRRGDLDKDLARMLLAPELASTPLQIVIAGGFAGAAAMSGERGYRRVLLAVGAMSEAIRLTATALGLAIVTTTDFYDRELDRLLGLDGIDVGALVLIAVGGAG